MLRSSTGALSSVRILSPASYVRLCCQNANELSYPNMQAMIKSKTPTRALTDFFFAETKYSIASRRSIPAKIRNVMAVPTAGILINVGTKVPIMMVQTIYDELK